MSSQHRGRRLAPLWTRLTSRFDAWGFSPGKIYTPSTVHPQTDDSHTNGERCWAERHRGAPSGRSWKFQSESVTPCVCVNWSQAHYLACSRLNLPPESTPFVDRCSRLLEGGELEGLNHSRQVWVGANFLLPFVMSSGRLCVFRYAFP